MHVRIDGEVKIDETVFEMGSVSRKVIERSTNGLDGIVSIDLGSRGRDICIDGVLRAASGIGLDNVTGLIEAKMDGGVCTLSLDDGRSFDNVRIDVFETTERQYGGSTVTCKCKLLCKQLKVS